MEIDTSNMRHPNKRFRDAADDELKAGWGKLPYDHPDICFGSGSKTNGGCDRALLHNELCHTWFELDMDKIKSGEGVSYKRKELSLIEELDRRGYDLSTLKFSIKMKRKDNATR
jgi:hypothetical protein